MNQRKGLEILAGVGLGIVFAAGAGLAAAGPDVLVAAERAFAQAVAAEGVRDGFLRWLAPTAVVFAPGPLNARQHYGARPKSAARLAWEPDVAVMSGAGDLGWTTGPWQWRSDSTHAEPQATGTFVTLWRLQPDGQWKWVLDVGVSHPETSGGRSEVASRVLSPVPSKGGALAQRRGLWKADADFAGTASQQGLAAALAAAASPNVRWLRDGIVPVLSRDAARDSAAARHPHGRMMSLAQFVSESGDLGYTYGTFVAGSSADPDSSYYLHIWQRAPARPWELALELFTDVPKRSK